MNFLITNGKIMAFAGYDFGEITFFATFQKSSDLTFCYFLKL
jgi:hypothetical protein